MKNQFENVSPQAPRGAWGAPLIAFARHLRHAD